MNEMKKLGAILVSAIAFATAGCELGVEGDELLEDELGEVQEGLCSRGCGGWENGIRQAAWNHVAGDGFKPYRLAQYGAGSSYGPYSVCERRWSGRDRDGSWVSNACVVREGWIRWASDDYTAGTVRTLRTEVFLKMLQVIGEPGQHYLDYISGDPNNIASYYDISCQQDREGTWGLATHALDNSWSYADMERVTGGLILMLNERNVHVEVALRTEGLAPPADQPSPGDFVYEEAIAYGNVFRGNMTVVAGGAYVTNPLKGARISNMNIGSVTNVFLYGDARCQFNTSNTSDHRRVATRCFDSYGGTWEYPVSARLRYPPVLYVPGTAYQVSIPGGGSATKWVY